MAGLVDTFAARQRSVTGASPGGLSQAVQPSRFNSTVGSSAVAATSSDDGGFWGKLSSGLRGIGDALGGITGQQGSGRSANGSTTSGGSSFAGSPNAANVGSWPKRVTTYTRSNLGEIQPALDGLAAQNTFTVGQIDAGIARLLNNQAARNAGFDNSVKAYKNQLAGQLANANLDIRSQDIQLANMPQWQRFLAEQWGNTMKAGKADLDFIKQQEINSTLTRGIDQREIAQGRKEVQQQVEQNVRDATSAATVSGVIQGARQDFADIETERGNALYGLDLADKKSAVSDLQRKQELANRRAQLTADLKGFDINTREGQAKLREREQLLQIEAEKARMAPRMLQDAMNVTLSNLNLDRQISQGQFLEALANAEAQKQAQLGQYLRDVSAWMNLVNTFQSTVPPAATTGFKPPSAGKKQTWDRAGFR